MLGIDHPDTLNTVNNLAALLGQQGNYAQAEPLYRRSLGGRERVLGKDHPKTLNSVNNLATMLSDKGDYSQAEPLFRRALEGRGRVLGSEHPDTLYKHEPDLAALLEKTDRADEARPLRLRYVELLASKSDTPPLTLRELALHCFKLGDYAKAEELLNRLLQSGFEPPSTRHHLARLCLITGRFDEAREQVAQAWAARADAKPYLVARLLWFQLALGMVKNRGQRKEAGDQHTVIVIGMLKTALQIEGVHMAWNMVPILHHLKARLNGDDHTLLTALVAALSDRANVEKLEEFPEWRDAAPQPLE